MKVFVPGVYSDKFENQPQNLPWARPFSPSFGGGATNPSNYDKHVLNDETGWCSVPHAGDVKTGSQVFVFFENGDINYPVYFGVAQSQEGWFSEHPNQHCFRSDNIRVRIDENVYDPRSTTKFASYSEHSTAVAKKNLERTCLKNGWKFDKENGQIDELETRLDIEIEATKINAVNLNIHGNVNLHIDGDWFVEHFGDKYEYQRGDRYVKHEGNTYIEEYGHVRKVLSGDNTFEHHGNYVENQTGDTLITRTGTYYDQIDNDVTHMYNGNYKMKVDGNVDEVIRNDKILDIGNGFNLNVVEDLIAAIGGRTEINNNASFMFNVKDDVNFVSRYGNITLETTGEFELMKDGLITAEGFRNMGTKGNINIVSTFGNIGIECKKNDELANFNKRCTVIPWNPDFVRQALEAVKEFPDFNALEATLKGMNFSTDINGFGDFVALLKEAQDLLIYDGLPVFLPTRMIVQNPNVVYPKNVNDLSWIPDFRNEASDWKNIPDDVMWKLPGRTMGNIRINTWSGDIDIKTESELGCAGNVNITAVEKAGTLPAYKIGTITIKNYGRERVYPDPRDLFFDSDFQQKNAGTIELFKHGTNGDSGSVLPNACNGAVRSTGYMFNFANTDYKKFYKVNSEKIATKGGVVDANSIAAKKILYEMQFKKAPKMGCPKCISDYLLGIPGIQETYYVNQNLVEMKGGIHEYGVQRLNPKDPINSRGVFNINAGDFDKISLGDGHAIGTGLMRRDFGSASIGGIVIDGKGDFILDIGRNYHRTINNKTAKGKTVEKYEYVETPLDFNAPQVLNNVISQYESLYNRVGGKAIKFGKEITLAVSTDESKTNDFGFRTAKILPKAEWIDGGYYLKHTLSIGDNFSKSEIDDHRVIVDYGFDFERARDIIVANNVTRLETNIKENETYEVKIERGADSEYHFGGDSRWFNVRALENAGGKTHVEISGSFNEHKYVIEDRSKHWMKSHTYHDQGFAWWDDDKFSGDAVKNFPDSEFDEEVVEVSKIWDELQHDDKNRAWSKYGNHIRDGRHPEYNKPTETCNARYKVTNKENANTAKKLWQNKRGAGVETKKNEIATANHIPSKHKLQCPTCGKNQNIISTVKWDAPTNIYRTDSRNAGKNNCHYNFVNGDINHYAITYTGAVNTHVMSLNSDRIAITPDAETDAGTMENKDQKTVQAGNLVKTEMKGNLEFFKHKLGENEKWGVYSNNYEMSQCGFPVNFYKILNGPMTSGEIDQISGASEPTSAKYRENVMTLINGGTLSGEESGILMMHANEAPTGKADLQGKNLFYFSNGSYDKASELNSFKVENGVNVDAAYNFTEISNGSTNKKGANIFRIDNQGSPSAETLENILTLNNDNEFTNIVFSDEYVSGNGEPMKQMISEYSGGTINKHAENVINVESMMARLKHDNVALNTTKLMAITKSTILHAPTFDFKGKTCSFNMSSASVVSETTTFHSQTFSAITDTTVFHAKSFASKLWEIVLDSDNIGVNANTLNVTATNTTLLGDKMSMLGSEVVVNKITATGEYSGHLNGSFDGIATIGGFLYFPSPLSFGPMGIAPGSATSGNPQEPDKPHTPSEPIDIKKPQPIANDKNFDTLENESLKMTGTLKKYLRKLIKIELSLLDVMNGK